MLNWNRAFIGNYRDRFLLWPVLLFSVLAIGNIAAPEAPGYRLYGFKLAACAVIAILLAKDRLIVLIGVFGYTALRLTIALAITGNWKAYGVGLLISIVVVVVLIPALRRWKSGYEDSAKTTILDVLLPVAGIVAAVAVVLLLRPNS
jgi:predicted transporter